MEEFVKVVKEFEIPMEKEFLDSFNENDFSELPAVLKHARNKINTMVDHFMNTAIYACIIEQLLRSTDWKEELLF